MTDLINDAISDGTGAPTTEHAADTPPARRGLRGRFARFRRTRPFWGGLVLLAGAYFIAFPVLGNGFAFFIDMGVRAMTPMMIGIVMAAAALVAVVRPAQRHFPAIVAMMLSVASLPLANLGGWIIGMVLGIVGSGLVFAWTPYSDKQLARLADRAQGKAARRDARRRARQGGTATAA